MLIPIIICELRLSINNPRGDGGVRYLRYSMGTEGSGTSVPMGFPQKIRHRREVPAPDFYIQMKVIIYRIFIQLLYTLTLALQASSQSLEL